MAWTTKPLGGGVKYLVVRPLKKNKKNLNGPLKIKKIGNPSTTHKLYADLGPTRYFGPKDPIIGSMGYGGWGLN